MSGDGVSTFDKDAVPSAAISTCRCVIEDSHESAIVFSGACRVQ